MASKYTWWTNRGESENYQKAKIVPIIALCMNCPTLAWWEHYHMRYCTIQIFIPFNFCMDCIYVHCRKESPMRYGNFQYIWSCKLIYCHKAYRYLVSWLHTLAHSNSIYLWHDDNISNIIIFSFQYFVVPHIDVVFDLSEPLVASRLRLLIHDGLPAPGNGLCWHLTFLGCPLSHGKTPYY